jgi:hypothetical protein
MCEASIRDVFIVSTLQMCQPYKSYKINIRILLTQPVFLNKCTPIRNNVGIVGVLETGNVFTNSKRQLILGVCHSQIENAE